MLSCNSTYRLRYWNLLVILLNLLSKLQQHLPFTVLKLTSTNHNISFMIVATALTVYGIETRWDRVNGNRRSWLQQHLPFTVLKQYTYSNWNRFYWKLQQHLPFTVLKLSVNQSRQKSRAPQVATALTVYGIETY